MAEWIYFIRPPREDFAETMTAEEEAVWGVHFERFQQALADGTLILVGPTLGRRTRESPCSRRPMRMPRGGSWRRIRSSPAASRPASCARSGSSLLRGRD